MSEYTHILPRKGDRVTIRGLKGKKEHNGRRGIVLGISSYDERRYKIRLEKIKEKKKKDKAQEEKEGEEFIELPQKTLSVRISNFWVYSSSSRYDSDSSGGTGDEMRNHNQKESKMAPLHVLVPCHVASERRIQTFQKCAQSLVAQCNNDGRNTPNTDFSVFCGLSGPEDYRNQAFRILSTLAMTSKIRWYLQDENVEAKPQMEHLRSLLVGASQPIHPKALLAFVDNDDLCHPLRFRVMLDAYENFRIDPENDNDRFRVELGADGNYRKVNLGSKNGNKNALSSLDSRYTLGMPCKLLLHPSLALLEGGGIRMKDLVDSKNPRDFTYWKKNVFNNIRKIQYASIANAEDMDAEEYFDFIVPSKVLQKFFELNPPKVTSNRYCDLRLYQVLEKLCPMDYEYYSFMMSDSIILSPDMWLLAHYKIPMEDKQDTFDRHGEREKNQEDQASFPKEQEALEDIRLAEQFPKLSPAQVAMCRVFFESIILSFVGWNEEMLQEAKTQKVFEVSQSHGPEFAKALWEESHAKMVSLFDMSPETLKESNDGVWDEFLKEGNNKESILDEGHEYDYSILDSEHEFLGL